MRKWKIIKIGKSNGQILIELLIGIAILALITIVITQMSVSGFKGTKVIGQQGVMDSLAQEALEAVEAFQAANWHNIYDLTKSTQEYYPKISSGAWTLTTDTADKKVTIDSFDYYRTITINNVSRDSNDNIVTSGGTDDPSTQKVTVSVTGTSTPTVTYSRYFTRFQNATAVQTDWAGGTGQETNPTSGTSSNFNTLFQSSSNIDTSTSGEIKLQL